MDDDGQHNTKDVKKILSKANKIYYSNCILLGSRGTLPGMDVQI